MNQDPATNPSYRLSPAWIAVWAVCSFAPILPFALPLFQLGLADSPVAYLIWIPLMSFCWAGWGLARASFRRRVGSRDLVAGGLLTLLTGGLLVFGIRAWPAWWFGHYGALLLWPFWSLGLLWTLFGTGCSKAVLKPAAYLILVWPPLYMALIDIANPALKSVTLSGLRAYADGFSWMRQGQDPEVFEILHRGDWIPLSVSNACSGSDSVLALLVLFPIVLVLFRIGFWRKALLIAAGCLLAVAGNTVRIAILFAALHQYGPRVALDILHPLLGPVIFCLLVVLLLLYGSRFMLSDRRPPQGGLQRPGRGRGVLAVAFAAALGAWLLPLYGWSHGSELKPIVTEDAEPADLLPLIAGYALSRVGAPEKAEYRGAQGETVLIGLRAAASGGDGPPSGHGRTVASGTFAIRPGIAAEERLTARPSVEGKGLSDLYATTSFTFISVADFTRRPIRVDMAQRIGTGLDATALAAIERGAGDFDRRVGLVPEREAYARFAAFRESFAGRLLRP